MYSTFKTDLKSVETLSELLQFRGETHPDAGYNWLDGDLEASASISLTQLDRRARAIAKEIREHVNINENVFLMYPPGLEFIEAFFGCMYAGVVAVPTYPPRGSRGVERARALIADSAARLALTVSDRFSSTSVDGRERKVTGDLPLIQTDNISTAGADWTPAAVTKNDLAFIQYTSGSTGQPKGVMLRHGNLIDNLSVIREQFNYRSSDPAVSWLPPYHDMGLIGGILGALYGGGGANLMAPASFMQNPLGWLHAISKYGASISGAPNFAYDLCVDRANSADLDGLDLSSWRVAFCGAEPVSPDTLERFCETFGPYGFRRDALLACYGMAETTLLVTSTDHRAFPHVLTQRSSRGSEETQGTDESTETIELSDGSTERRLVSCGVPANGFDLQIVDPKSCQPKPDLQEGEIWLAGPSVAEGYWNKPEETENTFCATMAGDSDRKYLRSGDLGFVRGGQLYVTGRLKDLIIVRGRNLYPQDIERAVGTSHEALSPYGTIAFGMPSDSGERLVVVAETRRNGHSLDTDSVFASIRQAISEQFQVAVGAIVLVRTGSLPRTTSGKVQRRACRQRMLNDELRTLASWDSSTPPSTASVQNTSAGSISSVCTNRLATELPKGVIEIEGWLTQRIGDHLNVPNIGSIDRTAPITQLGLDSVTAVMISGELQKQFGVNLPPTLLYDCSTIQDVAIHLDEERNKKPVNDVDEEQPSHGEATSTDADAGDSNRFPLSHGQQAMWITNQLDPESSAYNLVFAAKVAATVTEEMLRQAVEGIVVRHEVLRTTFETVDGRPLQCVAEEVDVSVPTLDAAGDSDEQLIERARQLGSAPFRLKSELPFRATVLRRGNGDRVLVMACHHIVADMWSLDVLVQQLRESLAEQLAGTPTHGEPLATSYAEFVRWESQFVGSDEEERLWGYWSEQLRGSLPQLNLPTDRPRPQQQTSAGQTHEWQLSDGTVERLKQLSRDENSTLFATMLALYKTLLHRQTQQEDLIVGTTVALRNQAEFEKLFGFLVNAVPIRTQPVGKKDFRSFLGEVRESMRGALSHQEYPFQRLVERLQPERDTSRSPVFQTMFTWDKARHAGSNGSDSAVPGSNVPGSNVPATSLDQPILMEQTGAAFDLTFCVFEVEGKLTVGLKYNTDLFDAETIARMADHFDRLVSDVLDNPTRRLEEFNLMSAAQRSRILVDFNRTDVGYSDTRLFHELFEQHAVMTPAAPALRAGHVSWNYGELNAQANQLAHYLSERGVGPGKMVGLFMPRSAQAVVSILAVWKTGAAYLPLAADYPQQRLQYMVDDARPDVILLDGAVLDDAPRCDGKVISLPQIHERLLDQPTNDLETETTADDAAYVIYTSGSTGNPKGVLLRHRGLCNLVEAQKRTYNVGPGDRVLQFSSLSFDASVVEMLLALTAGGELVMPTSRTLAGGAGLEDQLREDQITIATLPPSALAMIQSDNLPWLRTIVSAGEACTPDIVEKWGVGRRYFNAYGPTECTVWTTLAQLQPGEPIHIGRPIANVKAYILNSAMQPTPIGVPGELYLGGPGVAPGYLNRPELTAERFVSDPFSDDVFSRLYRTGDLARYTSDGNIDFLGRMDRQVKLRGHRIELGEIESVLSTHPAANHAVVKVIGSGQTARLVAYMVYQADAVAPNVDQLREHLADRLPVNMVPSHWVVLDELPLTPNGKVDRDALPAPDMERPELASEFVPVRNDVQRRMAEVWQTVLRVDRVGIEDNFFALGGASIQALEVAERAAQVGITLDPQLLFQYQTIAELSQHVEDGAPTASEPIEETSSHAGSSDVGTRPNHEETLEDTVDFISNYDTTCQQSLADEAPNDGGGPRMRIESLGVYLPENVVSTEEVLAGCQQPLEFPLERMTGIKSRRVVADDEFSYDLAVKSAQDCLAQSSYAAEDIDLLICCNISRCDGPEARFTFEPSTASRLRHELGMHGALAFDISNACAGFFTAMTVVDAMLADGAARRAMVVSGEHITHLSRTAQKEIEGFMDPRLASLTLGDSGAATILERSNTGGGFQDLSLFTMGAYHKLCVAKLGANGATMNTDALGAASVAIRPSIEHALNLLRDQGWSSNDMDHIILHQTSQTTLDSAMQEFNRATGETVCTEDNTVANLAERGNTATTTHMMALHDQIKQGRIRPGDGIVFGVSGSGQTLGTGLYIMDELAEPGSKATAERLVEPAPSMALGRRVRLTKTGQCTEETAAERNTIEMLREAGDRCLGVDDTARDDIALVLHAGVYRSEFVCEPALAAIAAGDLEINATIDDARERKTLAFDIMNGGVGFLNACYVAARMLQGDSERTALVMTSEIENNLAEGHGEPLGIEETAVATLMETDADNLQGFGEFYFSQCDDHLDTVETHTKIDGQGIRLEVRQDPRRDEKYMEALVEANNEFLARLGKSINDFDVVLAPQISPEFTDRLARRLNVHPERMPSLPSRGKDYFTCGLPLLIDMVQREELVKDGEEALVLTVGSGGQVGCATYRF